MDSGSGCPVNVKTGTKTRTRVSDESKKRGVPRIVDVKTIKGPKVVVKKKETDEVKERSPRTTNSMEALLASLAPLLEGWLRERMGESLPPAPSEQGRWATNGVRFG